MRRAGLALVMLFVITSRACGRSRWLAGEVLTFASKIADEIGYEIADDAPVSRVVLLSRDGLARRVR